MQVVYRCGFLIRCCFSFGLLYDLLKSGHGNWRLYSMEDITKKLKKLTKSRKTKNIVYERTNTKSASRIVESVVE